MHMGTHKAPWKGKDHYHHCNRVANLPVTEKVASERSRHPACFMANYRLVILLYSPERELVALGYV